MEKAPIIRYARTMTFGRFNIGHSGHIKLIQTMLKYGEEAHVYPSTGGTNNDWDLRVLLLRVLCREANVDLRRVKFLKARNAFEALGNCLKDAPFKEAVVVLGSDQTDLANTLTEMFDVPLIINSRTNSSTLVRAFLDSPGCQGSLSQIYEGNRYATRLAQLLRKEEQDRERSSSSSGKVAQTSPGSAELQYLSPIPLG